MKMLIQTVALCWVFQCVNPAFAAPRNSGSSQKSSPANKKPPKPMQPPCKVSLSLNFLDNDARGASQEDLTSAAWFARAVQLDDAQRQIAWNSLPTAPKSIHDLYDGTSHLHATVLEFERSILVMYRGTQDPLDYVFNALIYTSPGMIHGLPGWVHTGFLTNFGLSWRNLRKLIKSLNSEGRPVIFASHSLGGVLSQFAAWRLEKYEGVRVSKIFAFQTPTGGDGQFKKAFEERFSGRAFNTLYGDDITPYIPPSRSALEEFKSSTAKPLSGLLGRIVRTANYEALNDRFIVQSDGEILESQEQAENNFWKKYKSKSGGKGFPLGLKATSALVSDHNIDLVLCHLAKRN